MSPVAHSLNKPQIEAVAAFVSELSRSRCSACRLEKAECLDFRSCNASGLNIMAILAVGFRGRSALPGRAESLAVRNCTWCHGAAAQGYTPAPRLAGQRYQYLENQLADFHAHARDNPFSKQYMWGAAAHLSAADRRVIWRCIFQRCRRKRPMTAIAGIVALGRTIYQEGMPDYNIVACVVCHGPNAEGVATNSAAGGACNTPI